MKQRKEVLRTCVVSREQLNPKDMVRVVRTKDGNIFVNPPKDVYGRSAYIKKDLDILEKAKKTNVIAKSLNVDIGDEIYTLIEKEITKPEPKRIKIVLTKEQIKNLNK